MYVPSMYFRKFRFLSMSVHPSSRYIKPYKSSWPVTINLYMYRWNTSTKDMSCISNTHNPVFMFRITRRCLVLYFNQLHEWCLEIRHKQQSSIVISACFNGEWANLFFIIHVCVRSCLFLLWNAKTNDCTI